MSLSAAYQQFLAAPSPEALAGDATLSYVTTLTSFSEAAQIVRHLGSQQKVLRKQSEKVLSAIENDRAVFLEIETTIEFISGGGAYLPGLDDNFLADRIVVFPILHVVHFDSQGKIQNVRIYWDQGSLLKTVEVIGSRGKNWPIKEGKDQIRLITSTGPVADTASSSSYARKQSASRPHTSVEPYAAYTEDDPEKTPTFKSPPTAPRALARPPPRDFGELLSGGEPDTASDGGPPSPTKSDIIAPKIGAGKNYHENRLFESVPGEGMDKYISPHPTKYSHFEFGASTDDSGPKPSPPKARTTKHQSQWDFADFVTPAKVVPSRQQGGARSFSFDDDNDEDDSQAAPAHMSREQETPMRKTSANAGPPRRDAATHFELQDDGEAPEGSRARQAVKPGHSRGPGSANMSASLFENNVISETGPPAARTARPLGLAYSQKDRSKDFGAHWEVTDDPAHGSAGGKEGGKDVTAKQGGLGARVEDRHRDFDPQFAVTDQPSSSSGGAGGAGGLGEKSASETNRPLGENKSKAVKMMEANWMTSDASPGPAAGGVGGKENERIRTGGDGLGSRKGTGRSWGFGDEEEEDLPLREQKGGRKVNMSNQPTKGVWDF